MKIQFLAIATVFLFGCNTSNQNNNDTIIHNDSTKVDSLSLNQYVDSAANAVIPTNIGLQKDTVFKTNYGNYHVVIKQLDLTDEEAEMNGNVNARKFSYSCLINDEANVIYFNDTIKNTSWGQKNEAKNSKEFLLEFPQLWNEKNMNKIMLEFRNWNNTKQEGIIGKLEFDYKVKKSKLEWLPIDMNEEEE